MPDRETVLIWLEICGKNGDCSSCCPYGYDGENFDCRSKLMADALSMLKEQEAKEVKVSTNMYTGPWDVLWKAPDGTFKGKCDNCGFVHVFIEGHVTQYKFCPQCGEQKQEL